MAETRMSHGRSLLFVGKMKAKKNRKCAENLRVKNFSALKFFTDISPSASSVKSKDIGSRSDYKCIDIQSAGGSRNCKQ